MTKENGTNQIEPSKTLELYRGQGEEAVMEMHKRLQEANDLPAYIEIEVQYEHARNLGSHMATFIQALESLVKILADMNYRVTIEQPNPERFTIIKAWSPKHPERMR